MWFDSKQFLTKIEKKIYYFYPLFKYESYMNMNMNKQSLLRVKFAKIQKLEKNVDKEREINIDKKK